MVTILQGLREDGFEVIDGEAVPLVRGGASQRVLPAYQGCAKVRAELAEPIKALIEEEPSFGYRTVAGLLGMNKNTVQRIFQLNRWQVRKRPTVEFHPKLSSM